MTMPTQNKQSLQMREALCIFTAFAYLTNVIENNNGVIPERLKFIYNRSTKIMLMYKQWHEIMIEQINEIVKYYPTTEIDLMLTSVAIFAEYYEQMRGRKRTFNPIDYKHIDEIRNEIESELIELGQQNKVFDTYDYCYSTVKKILCL